MPAMVAGLLILAISWGAGGAASAQDRTPTSPAGPPPLQPIAVVEFVIIDASARPDVEVMRATLNTSGKSAAAWLNAELAASGRYTPAAETRVVGALQTTGLSARDCTGVACLVELGRRLEVDRVVTGSVSKISNLIWYLSATMVDVRAGRVRFHEEFELKGNIADLLPRGIRALARRLVTSDSTLSREDVLAALARASEEAPADFSGHDLSGLDLSGVDFKRANLSRCRLVGTNLGGARMFAVRLDDAVAVEANFSGAVLDVAWMRRMDLTRAVLRDASLYATLLTGADLSDADLTRARVIAAMGGARLRRAKLVHANLGADRGNQPMGLMRTDATGADFTEADLSDANLRKADLTRANLTGADLTGADLAGADLTGTILRAIRGRDKIRGLDQARHLDQAIVN